MYLTAAPCAPGTFSETGLAPCEKCPISTYQPESGKTFCYHCEFDQLTDTEGATSKEDCGELIKVELDNTYIYSVVYVVSTIVHVHLVLSSVFMSVVMLYLEVLCTVRYA